MSVNHVLKTLPDYYDAVARGEKPFEVRRDDRGFQKGDTLTLQKLVKGRSGGTIGIDVDATGKPVQMVKTITYVLTGGQFGIEPGYVVLGLSN